MIPDRPTSLSHFFRQLLDVPSSDPDSARRRKLLNVMLVGVMGVALFVAVSSLLLHYLRIQGAENVNTIIFACLVSEISTIILYLINRFWSGTIAIIIFQIFLMLALTLTDTPHELASGRSLFLFVIPIITASVLLGATACWIFWVLVSIEIGILAQIAGDAINVPAIISYAFISLISWLSSRSLEQALKDLRTTNAELDQRVEDRTRELSEALSREKIEAGRREAILNSIADGVVVFDRNGTAILANPSIAQLLNKPQEMIIGSGLNDLLASNELKAGERGKLAALLEKSAHEFSNFRVQLGKKTLSVNAADVRDDRNHPIGTVAVLRDFTNEAELEKMKNTFIAIVSHELRTPLNAILGYAEMLREAVYGQVNEKQKNASARIMMNAQRLLGIVTDLLDQAQIEAGKLKIQVMPCKPAELLDNLHGVMDKIVSDKNIDLITELDPSMPPTIIGDPQRLQQILVNLTSNAVKFTDRGSIHVTIRPDHDGKTWQIQTLDTGSGIPEDAREYIFETFRQVEGASTREHGGVGLGLAIVKQLVELMNGKVTVESEIAKGSTFTVTLPLIPYEAAK